MQESWRRNHARVVMKEFWRENIKKPWSRNPPTSLSVERVRLMNLAYPPTYLHTYRLRDLHAYVLGLSTYPLTYLNT